MKKTVTHLSDGRELIYYDESDAGPRDAPDRRDLPQATTESEIRYDPVMDEWVVVASHRQSRTYLPPAELCPLCPSAAGRLTEIPEPSYDVVVFENRFPSLAERPCAAEGELTTLTRRRPGIGRCEVVCFTSDHDGALGQLGHRRLRTIVDVWADRTDALSRLDGVKQVMPFENRGEQIGVTLRHPHGQIYAYPFVTPRMTRKLASAGRHSRRTGECLFCSVVAAETAAGTRVVTGAPGWIAFVPAAARWPYELHLYPVRHIPDLPGLTDGERDGLAVLLKDVLGRFDGLFGDPMPYVLAFQQAPVGEGGELAHLHVELTSPRRAKSRLKYLAGSETAAGVFINDIVPEVAAERLRSAAPGTTGQ
ncbi:MAG TPA: galactose-1-phosphate uridylyltransferase [Candidatus Dormibacteraeota bacterium]